MKETGWYAYGYVYQSESLSVDSFDAPPPGASKVGIYIRYDGATLFIYNVYAASIPQPDRLLMTTNDFEVIEGRVFTP